MVSLTIVVPTVIPVPVSLMVAAVIPVSMSFMMSAVIPASMPVPIFECIFIFPVSFFPVTADFIQK